MDWCAYPAWGSSESWSCWFWRKDSRLSIFSFAVTVFSCFPSLSVKASTVAPARGLANSTVLHTLTPLRFFRGSFHILSVALRINLSNSALGCAVAVNLRFLLFPLPSSLFLSLISPFQHLVDRAQILIFFAVASNTLPSASWQHSASHSTSSTVLSTPRYALPLARSLHSFTACSLSSYDMAARFHPMTCVPPPSSCFSMSTSHSMFFWSYPVAWFRSKIDHFPNGWLASISSMVDTPSLWLLVQWWVGRSSFPITSPCSSISSSQCAASLRSVHLGFQCWLWVLKIPLAPCRLPPAWWLHASWVSSLVALLSPLLSDHKR